MVELKEIANWESVMTDNQKNLLLTAGMGSFLSLAFLPATWWYYPLFYLISYPWKFQGHVNSLWGGVCADGSVGSFVCVYQEARSGDAICIFGWGVQKASRDAVAGGGILLKQQAGDCAHFGIGAVLYQHSGYFSRMLFGIMHKQSSARDVKLHLGIAYVQQAVGRFRGWGVAMRREKQTASR